MSLCASLLMGREVRASVDETELHHASASMLAARDRAQSPAVVLDRTPVFQGHQPGATYTELAQQQLKLYDINAKRAISVSPFRSDGRGDPLAFEMLREFMRCRRTGHTMDMNPGLVRLLMRISAHFNGAELQIISAHRAVDGIVTSERSQHGKGTASDIRVAGVAVEALAEAAHEEGARGVGIYTHNQFVHVDVREKPYSWREGEASGEDEGEDLEGEDLAAADLAAAESPAEPATAEPAGPAGADTLDVADVVEDRAERAADTLEGATLSGL